MWKRLLKVRDILVNKFGSVERVKNTINECCSNDKVILSAMYSYLIQPAPLVNWHDTVWDGLLYPKHSFTLWLTCDSRLLTKDRLFRMGMLSTNQSNCVLCQWNQRKTINHIFFECQFSAEVWNKIMEWLRFKWKPCNWNQLLNWYSCNLRGKGPMKKHKRMLLSMTMYTVWQERNFRIFQGKKREAKQIVHVIKFLVYTKVLNENSYVHIRDLLKKI
ncbi:uncharacterized protein LOC109842430 [Asparagus officinalis]|uniref:uncharacterized protein LOC109842430 n=1 Tax=Asparagus officinalis TaxID=4686 RepID=UPI00098E639A|nr:uncharacterized protein LOC109842430 [Asparagus officinalis]